MLLRRKAEFIKDKLSLFRREGILYILIGYGKRSISLFNEI